MYFGKDQNTHESTTRHASTAPLPVTNTTTGPLPGVAAVSIQDFVDYRPRLPPTTPCRSASPNRPVTPWHLAVPTSKPSRHHYPAHTKGCPHPNYPAWPQSPAPAQHLPTQGLPHHCHPACLPDLDSETTRHSLCMSSPSTLALPQPRYPSRLLL